MSRGRGERGTTLVEVLVASALGLVVVLAAVQLLKTHARLALQAQADLGATNGAAWALRRVLRDVKRAGADPRQRGLGAFVDAEDDRLTMAHDADADGHVDASSGETVAVLWSAARGGQVSRRVGRQSMPIVSRVPRGGFRLRYYDADGRMLPPSALQDAAGRRRIRRVAVDLEVVEHIGLVRGRAALGSAAAIRVREGDP